MKFSSIIFFGAGLVCSGTSEAQIQPPTQNPGLTKSGAGTLTLNGSNIYIGGSTVYAGPGYITAPYGSGRFPNLQDALVALAMAQDSLATANPSLKAEYLPRAIVGVQMAMQDVRLAIDNGDGNPTPPVAALPALPAGVGNATSREVVVPTLHPTVSSPNMEYAITQLNAAMKALQVTGPANKGIFLPRAIADVTFAIDNANAAINLSNHLPATQPKSPSSVSPLSPSFAAFDMREIGGAVVLMAVLLAIGVEQAMRKRTGR